MSGWGKRSEFISMSISPNGVLSMMFGDNPGNHYVVTRGADGEIDIVESSNVAKKEEALQLKHFKETGLQMDYNRADRDTARNAIEKSGAYRRVTREDLIVLLRSVDNGF